jgi:hypothetical protein
MFDAVVEDFELEFSDNPEPSSSTAEGTEHMS